MQLLQVYHQVLAESHTKKIIFIKRPLLFLVGSLGLFKFVTDFGVWSFECTTFLAQETAGLRTMKMCSVTIGHTTDGLF